MGRLHYAPLPRLQKAAGAHTLFFTLTKHANDGSKSMQPQGLRRYTRRSPNIFVKVQSAPRALDSIAGRQECRYRSSRAQNLDKSALLEGVASQPNPGSSEDTLV